MEKMRKRNRLESFDYSKDGLYFVTICTKDKKHFFGEVVDRLMVLDSYGKVVKKCWRDIPKHFENVKLDNFIIMPNHFHGILRIVDPTTHVGNADLRSYKTKQNSKRNADIYSDKTNQNSKRNADLRSLRQDRTKMHLSKVIHGFKSSVTRCIRKQYGDFVFQWHKSFYDHIIRGEKSLFNIQQYIQNNPPRWAIEKQENISEKFVNTKATGKPFPAKQKK